jgi:hypothetical protein
MRKGDNMLKIRKEEQKLTTEQLLDYHDSKSVLAKILAGEDLDLVHDSNAKTAYIDLQARRVCIPMWNNMTPSVYDLFLAHEVSHALNTPLEGYHGNGEYPAGFRSFLNVTEDSRIERLIIKKYPGLRAVFSRAYGTLFADDFFGLGDKPISDRIFIDRLNLHTKLNSMHDQIKIEFNDIEQGFVDRLQTCDTFEEILDITKEIYDYCKEEQEQKEQEQDDEYDISDDDQSSSEEQDSMSQDDDSGDEETISESSGDSDDSDEDQESYDKEQSFSQSDDGAEESESSLEEEEVEPSDEYGEEVVCETYENQERSMDQFSSDGSDLNIYNVEYNQSVFEKDNPNITHLRLKDYYKNAYSEYTKLSTEDINNMGIEWIKQDQVALDWLKGSNLKFYNRFLKENNSAINTMVQGFMRKKSASNYYRNTESKTGVLNMSKLHGYKYNEDLFKKVVNNFDGDNYGMVFLLDQSGSMCNNSYVDLLEQLLILVEFCRRVQMPYKVYSFYSSTRSNPRPTDEELKNFYTNKGLLNKNLISHSSHDGTLILEWLSSEDKSNDHKKLSNFMIGGLLSSVNRYYYSNKRDDQFYFGSYARYYEPKSNNTSAKFMMRTLSLFEFGGTPLNDSLCFLRGQICDFKQKSNAEKVTLVTLTDGSNSSPVRAKNYSNTEGRFYASHVVTGSSWEKTNMINLKIDGKTHKIDNRRFESYTQDEFLKVLFDFDWINCIKINWVHRSYTTGSFQKGVTKIVNLTRDLTKNEKKFRCIMVEDDLILSRTMYDKEIIVFGIKDKELDVELDTSKKVTKNSLGKVLNSMNIESNRKKMLANSYIDTITL